MELKHIASLCAVFATLELLFRVSYQTVAKNGLVFSVVPSDTADKHFTYFTLPIIEKVNLASINKTWFDLSKSRLYFISMAIDSSAKCIYAYDAQSSCIYIGEKFSLENSASRWSIIQEDVSGDNVKLAADWMNHNLYWTDQNCHCIGMRPMNTSDPTMYKIIIDKELTNPWAIAVDPVSKLLFWSDIGDSTKIERSYLSGGNRSVLVSGGLVFPVSIATDSMTNRIFWADSERDTIESIGYNSQQRKLFFQMTGSSFLDIAICEDSVYILDGADTSNGVYILSKANGKINEFIKNERDHRINAIAVLESHENKIASESCIAAGCEHFCVSGETNAECQCKNGYQLNKDGTTCSVVHGTTEKLNLRFKQWFRDILKKINDWKIEILITFLCRFIIRHFWRQI